MISSSITADEVIEFLNRLVAIDPIAITALIAKRVSCNQALAEHPTVQVSVVRNGWKVGFLGVLNGLFGVYPDGFGCIAAVYANGKGGKLVGFVKLSEEEEHQCL